MNGPRSHLGTVSVYTPISNEVVASRERQGSAKDRNHRVLLCYRQPAAGRPLALAAEERIGGLMPLAAHPAFLNLRRHRADALDNDCPSAAHGAKGGVILRGPEAGMYKPQPCSAVDRSQRPCDDAVEP